jgi:hypothetical protein
LFLLYVGFIGNGVMDMNFRDARDLAAEFGCKRPRFDHTASVAACWIDRMEWVLACAERPADLADAITEANRYA